MAASRTGRRAPAAPGRARPAPRSSPAVASSHGPKPRDYSQRTPKKMKAAALRGALSDRARAGLVHVVSALRRRRRPVDQGGPHRAGRPSPAPSRAGRWSCWTRGDEVSWLSLRNLPNVHVLAPDQLNTYDVLVNDVVVFTQRRAGRVPGGPDRGAHRASRSRAAARRRAGRADQGARGEEERAGRRGGAVRPGQPPPAGGRLASPTASRSRATPTRCSTTCRAARSTSAPRPRSGSPTRTPPSGPASSCRRPNVQRRSVRR